MLILAELEIFSANKYENANAYLLAEKCSCLAMFNKNEFTIVRCMDYLKR